MSNQIQMNKQLQFIREDFQNKIKLINNELTTNKNELTYQPKVNLVQS